MAYVLSGLLGQLPLLIVLIAGFVLVTVNRHRINRRSAMFARLGLGVLGGELVLRWVWTIVFPQLISALDVRASGLGMLSFGVGLILAVVGAAGIGLLIAAIVSRSPSETGPAPAPPTEVFRT